MQFNVLEHEMVPEHRLLTKEEAQEVLTAMDITRDQLPKIRTTDPALRVLARAQPAIDCPECGTKTDMPDERYVCPEGHFERDIIVEGSIVKILRMTSTAGVSEAYRLVIGR